MARKMGNVRPGGRTRREAAKKRLERDRKWGGPDRCWLVGRMMLQLDTGNYEHEWLLVQAASMADASAMADITQAERKAKVAIAFNLAQKKMDLFNPAMP